MKKILVFVDWYSPGYKAGGPIKSCISLVERLHSFYHFKVITTDTDLNEVQPYAGIQPDRWSITAAATEVYYFSKAHLKKENIEKIIKEEYPDIIYLNSMFSWYFTLLPLWIIRQNNLNCKVVVAPRGMLSKGALALKPFKKQLFLLAARMLGLFGKVTFHASSEIEVNETKAVFGEHAKVLHAMNLTPDVKVIKINREKIKNKLRLIYVGRISEVKNLLQCIKMLNKISSDKEIIFDIYGPYDDPGYYEQCKKEIASLPPNVQIILKGPADNAAMAGILSNYHFLFLLSMNENYGHAIVESFTAGCPVIIGNRTPWKNLENKKCGWDLPLDQEEKILKALNTAAEMNQETYDQWSDAAADLATGIHNDKKTIEDHHLLFSTAEKELTGVEEIKS